MPRYLFNPLARQQSKLTFKAVAALSDIFRTSKTATAIRLVEADQAPAMLVCHGHNGRRWFTRAPSVPERWFPQDALDAESFAFGVLFGNRPDDFMPRRIGADASGSIDGMPVSSISKNKQSRLATMKYSHSFSLTTRECLKKTIIEIVRGSDNATGVYNSSIHLPISSRI